MVLHQANIRIMQAMSEKLEVPEERLIVNLDKYGNTSAASIPIALNEAVLSGKIQPGHLLALCGFGAGLAWATAVLRWTCVDQRLVSEETEQKQLEAQSV
jgi:3-oxoacyl-[acyl-carrier-protein] synthase-3